MERDNNKQSGVCGWSMEWQLEESPRINLFFGGAITTDT